MHFAKKFKKALRDTKSHLVIGLDTDVTQIPKYLRGEANPIAKFNELVIEATKDIVCGYKLNIAFYERAGELGWTAIKSAIKDIPENLMTIADAKRGDIENTTELYAQSFFDEYNFDSVTVHPYMGSDSIRPFIRRKNKFAFILVLTSNYGSKDFQFLKVGNKPLWEIVAEKAMEWNSEKIGFVVGANHTRELEKITKLYPETPVLIPGIGWQKNSIDKTMNALKHNNFIINQSRSIIYSAQKADNDKDFMEIVREKGVTARDDINVNELPEKEPYIKNKTKKEESAE